MSIREGKLNKSSANKAIIQSVGVIPTVAQKLKLMKCKLYVIPENGFSFSTFRMIKTIPENNSTVKKNWLNAAVLWFEA